MIRPSPQKAQVGHGQGRGVEESVSDHREYSLLIPIQSSPKRNLTTSDLRPRGVFLPPASSHATVDQVPKNNIGGVSRCTSPWTVQTSDAPSLKSSTHTSNSAFSPFPFYQASARTSLSYVTPTKAPRPSLATFVPIQTEDEPRSFSTPKTHARDFDIIQSPFNGQALKGKESPAATVDTAPLTIADSPSFATSEGRFVAYTPTRLGGFRSPTPTSITLRTPTPSSRLGSPSVASLRGTPVSTIGETCTPPPYRNPNYCTTILESSITPPSRPPRPVSTIPFNSTTSTQTPIPPRPKARPKSAPTVCSREPSDDELARKVRLKTELCMHFESGGICPFGEGMAINCLAFCIMF